MQTIFYAIQAIANKEKYLCWQEKGRLYFAGKAKGFLVPPPPTLFLKKKDAADAIKLSKMHKTYLKKFVKILNAEKVKIVKVEINILTK